MCRPFSADCGEFRKPLPAMHPHMRSSITACILWRVSMKTLISTLLVIGLSIAFTVPSLAGDEPTTKAACKKPARYGMMPARSAWRSNKLLCFQTYDSIRASASFGALFSFFFASRFPEQASATWHRLASSAPPRCPQAPGLLNLIQSASDEVV